ncbi:MAG: alpha/beta hydrolase [Bacteroidia bacterium]
MQHYIHINYKARYFTYGNLSDTTKNIWFVCHGYGQLAEYFIRKFYILNPDENFVIVPEGLHRFYLNGHSGRVGASWMTKEDRLTDIENYIQFLDSVYFENVKNTKAKIILLGFSQGAATASRWAAMGKSKIDKLILWAGVFPPDLPFENCLNKINQLNPLLVIGNKDEFISAEEMQEKIKWLDSEKINYQLHTFEGKHDIDGNVLIDIYKIL